jgi:hypothetical protein
MDKTSSDLANIPKLRKFKRKRISSYDRTGGNSDWFEIHPNERKIIFDIEGPGCVKHIWMTMAAVGAGKYWRRDVIIRFYWDNEKNPSVEVPISDFFGVGHGEIKNFVSAPLQMSPRGGRGFNCWWPMPFKRHGKIEIESQLSKKFNLYFYIDYEKYDEFPNDSEVPIGYFHAQFRMSKREKDQKKDRDTGKKFSKMEWQFTGGKNTRVNGGYDLNHKILHAKGKGQYVGCHLDIDNRARFLLLNWPGEGDDMIFIDEDIGGEPTLYGTGTEDYVNTAYSPRKEEYNAQYHGLIKGGGPFWIGKITYYRYHILDPVSFEKEILVTIERGHDNHRLSDRWDSTAYWYQLEPHEKFPELPSMKERKPRKESNLWKSTIWIAKWIFRLVLAGAFGYFLFWLFFTYFK